jgi:hypothetical protein
MNNRARFCLNLLAPPPIAAVLFAVGSCIGSTSFEPLAWLPVMVLVAYLYAGLPSLLHALIMGALYRRGVNPCGVRALAFSSLNGLVAGLMIYLFIAALTGTIEGSAGLLWLSPLGAATGAANALLQRLIFTAE